MQIVPQQDLSTILSTGANPRRKKTDSTLGTCNLFAVDSTDSSWPASFTEPIDQIIDFPISVFETPAVKPLLHLDVKSIAPSSVYS